MNQKISTLAQYMEQLPQERFEAISKLINTIEQNLPKGFELNLSYGMPTFVVPHSIYPKGYCTNPKQALPFISVASQKNFISLYHMGIYAVPELLEWFKTEHAKHQTNKLDMGKSCIRYKKMQHIPFELIAELSQKISVKDWIEIYETQLMTKK